MSKVKFKDDIKFRKFDPVKSKKELKRHLVAVQKRILALEKAQEVSQEFLDTTINI